MTLSCRQEEIYPFWKKLQDNGFKTCTRYTSGSGRSVNGGCGQSALNQNMDINEDEKKIDED